ncbi:sugar ABC transporter ATP-binding protein [Nocardioides sp. GXZ039]|uniref:sugar ABC transporter ATP-binding protein n=1 Tax=Nocardioides sp. GXZ039 TaxID=3136018 RepID=UPI0030F3DC67
MTLLQVQGLEKSFFGQPVLRGIDLDLEAGEVHGLVGENGAGKSTVMKILAGVHRADGGSVRIDGEPVDFTHPSQAYAAGISTVFQEFTLIPHRTVAENIYLGREPRRLGIVSTKKMNADAAALLGSIGVTSISPRTRVRNLSVAEQQIVEIAKALSYDARVLSMDEPTAALADHEVELLYGIIGRLTERGVAILYVSHRLKEIFDLCTTVTVLKDGAQVVTAKTAELDESSLVRHMVGREIESFFPPAVEGTTPGEAMLELDAAGNRDVDDITLEVRAGEIVAVAGLQGSGRTELLEAIAGVRPFTRGAMTANGVGAAPTRPRRAIRNGTAFLTEDRKASGLLLNQSVKDNAALVARAVAPRSSHSQAKRTDQVLKDLNLKSQGTSQEIRYLSGGNQQKVLLAKWLVLEPAVILLDEPTRGIDVGAKRSVYELMRKLAHSGAAILMVSSDLPEVVGIADRILVMHDGRLVGELAGGSSEEDIMRTATLVDRLEGVGAP